MTKSSHPLDVYRRKQRQAEIKKNKTARIRARDAKVAATKSTQEIKSEIAALERKRDRFGRATSDDVNVDESGNQGLDAASVRKLERLRKELRIVTAEATKRREMSETLRIEQEKELLKAQKTVEGVQSINEAKYSLVERYASVYYDPMLNPYGAPPPGQPTRFYADEHAKSTTMDLRMAVVPEKWKEKLREEKKKKGELEDSDFMQDESNQKRQNELVSNLSEASQQNQQLIHQHSQQQQPQQQSQIQNAVYLQGTSMNQVMSQPSSSTQQGGLTSLSVPYIQSNQTQIHPIPSALTIAIQHQGPLHGEFSSQAPDSQASMFPPPPPPPPPPVIPQTQAHMHQELSSNSVGIHCAPTIPPLPPTMVPPLLAPPYNGFSSQAPGLPSGSILPPLPPIGSQTQLFVNHGQGLMSQPPFPPPPPPPPLPIHPSLSRQVHPSLHSQSIPVPPPLPPPSQSVIRASKKLKDKSSAITADIWASQEEIEYEQSKHGNGKTSLFSIEGVGESHIEQQEPYLPRWQRNKLKKAQTQKTNGTVTKTDVNSTSEQEYDPCCPSALGYAEYRNRDQIERQAKVVHTRQREQVEKVKEGEHGQLQLNSLDHSPQQLPLHTPEELSWYYLDNSSGAVQGPFSGIQMHAWKCAGFFPQTTPVRQAAYGPFVALSQVDLLALPPTPPPLSDELHPIEVANEVIISEADIAEPPPSDDEEDENLEVEEENKSPGEDTSHSYPHDPDGPEVDMCFPPPSDDEGEDAHAMEESNTTHLPYDLSNLVEAPYPVDIGYPIPSNDTMMYPLDIEYPVVDYSNTYPKLEDVYNDLNQIPAVAPYPSAEIYEVNDTVEHRVQEAASQPSQEKKKYDGDKVVVSFVPSHLLVKRKGASSEKTNKIMTKPKDSLSHKDSIGQQVVDKKKAQFDVAEDYDKFMEEISELN